MFFCSSPENATVKELLKLVNIWPSYCQNEKGVLFMTDQVVTVFNAWNVDASHLNILVTASTCLLLAS